MHDAPQWFRDIVLRAYDSFSKIDRYKIPKGPWMQEDDCIPFVYKGFYCVILRNKYWSLTGHIFLTGNYTDDKILIAKAGSHTVCPGNITVLDKGICVEKKVIFVEYTHSYLPLSPFKRRSKDISQYVTVEQIQDKMRSFIDEIHVGPCTTISSFWHFIYTLLIIGILVAGLSVIICK